MSENSFFDGFEKSAAYQMLQSHPVAYFCAEFALASELSTYAGGLGVLAGDLVREAFDCKFPLVGVGIYYYVGYRYASSDAVLGEKAMALRNPQEHGLKPVFDSKGQRVKVSIPVMGRQISIQAWLFENKTAPVYLLDTNLEENDLEDRKISWFLYTNEKATRLKQQMVLGIGGYRFLKAMGIDPSIYHLNEGNSAFLSYELAKDRMYQDGIKFTQAQELVKGKIVFTNHTLVAAGNDVFENELFSLLFANYIDEIGVPFSELLAQGEIMGANAFSMTRLALSSAGKINAVSKLHGEYATKIWPNYPVVSITNGIHLPTWDRIGFDDIWTKHQANKSDLIKLINDRSGTSWTENEFLVGWARRIVRYKRPLALFDYLDGFIKMASSQSKPVRAVFSGRPHPEDPEGAQIVKILKDLAEDKLKNYLVYLDNYDLDLAQSLTSGCDLWLNTPFVGFEACGTSGMKAALNGALLMSTDDGWMAEVNFANIGWNLESSRVNQSLIFALNSQVIPLYYQRDANGRSTEWIETMSKARELILNNFSSSRMLRQYIENLY